MSGTISLTGRNISFQPTINPQGMFFGGNFSEDGGLLDEQRNPIRGKQKRPKTAWTFPMNF